MHRRLKIIFIAFDFSSRTKAPSKFKFAQIVSKKTSTLEARHLKEQMLKRYFDDVRCLLLAIEACDNGCGWTIRQPPEFDVRGTKVDTVAPQSLAFHVVLLLDARLITASISETNSCTAIHGVRLAWTGCDFLDSIRSKSIWKKVKQAINNPEVQSASFSVWAAVATDFIKRSLSLP